MWQTKGHPGEHEKSINELKIMGNNSQKWNWSYRCPRMNSPPVRTTGSCTRERNQQHPPQWSPSARASSRMPAEGWWRSQPQNYLVFDLVKECAAHCKLQNQDVENNSLDQVLLVHCSKQTQRKLKTILPRTTCSHCQLLFPFSLLTL